MDQPVTVEAQIGGRALTIETGSLAEQANGAVTVRYGDTIALVTACMSNPREGTDFLPLRVDFEARLYAAGKIPGGFIKREGRPTDNAVLNMRFTDRSLRPLFPKHVRHELQIVVTVLSADQENDPGILAIIGASSAVSLSEIPFAGPISATTLGYVDGELIVNPTYQQLQVSDLDLIVSGTRDAVVMVEAGARQVSEDLMLRALRLGQEVNAAVIDLQEQLCAGRAKPKVSLPAPEPNHVLEAAAAAFLGDRVASALANTDSAAREAGLDALRAELVTALSADYAADVLGAIFDAQLRAEVRRAILERGIRPDGRQPEEIRRLASRAGFIPRTHGSGLFHRGQTQVLTLATLGSLGEHQRLDWITPEESKRFIHHYNMPPFASGEARPMRGPARREIGHGALVERALFPLIPSEEDFPYTIRLVSEVLSSNGSTSMASVCASTLSLMDAGVPMLAPVAGIAMGLIKGDTEADVVLTDIQGMEDHLGDMDFKVAGTREGITALQMDIKVAGISEEVMARALEQARLARVQLLDHMAQTLDEPRADLSPFAPRMLRITIPTEKIGAVIGPGGRMIRSIIEETGASIDVEDDGTVFIGSPNLAAAEAALEKVKSLVRDVEVGEIFTGRVTRLMKMGVFVEILPRTEGLVTLRELSDTPIERPEDVVDVGDELTVKVVEIDRLGRVNLSRRVLLPGQENESYEDRRRDEPRREPARRFGG